MPASWQWLSAPVGMLTPPKSGGGDPHLGYLRTLEIGTRRVHPPTFRLGQWRGDGKKLGANLLLQKDAELLRR